MDTKHQMAIAGSGLVTAGIGLGLVGTALIAPAVFAWTMKLVDEGTERLASKLESASRSVGTIAGTLQRSFSEATRAGATEIRRGSPKSRDIAS